MAGKVELYNHAYGEYDLYAEIRTETYGEDLGQTSWVSTEESREIPELLGLTDRSHVLEIGCGSGRYAIRVAETTGCKVIGVDINRQGIDTANELARQRGISPRIHFASCDVSKSLPFEDGTFDAVFANDVLCHVARRQFVLSELHRVLRKGGRMLFSDALVVGGLLTQEEIAIRSSIGFYLFSPPGTNEGLIQAAGFNLVAIRDTTANAAAIAQRWHLARRQRREELVRVEGLNDFEGLQLFLSGVYQLSSERRLLRYVYLAEKQN
jgi:SAM-dependent methyltransferase